MRKISKQKIGLLKSQIEKAMGLLFVKGFIKKIIVRTSQVIIFRIVLLEEYIFDCESFEEIMGEISDLTHNMDLSRIKEVTQKDLERVGKYKKAFAILSKE